MENQDDCFIQFCPISTPNIQGFYHYFVGREDHDRQPGVMTFSDSHTVSGEGSTSNF